MESRMAAGSRAQNTGKKKGSHRIPFSTQQVAHSNWRNSILFHDKKLSNLHTRGPLYRVMRLRAQAKENKENNGCPLSS